MDSSSTAQMLREKIENHPNIRYVRNVYQEEFKSFVDTACEIVSADDIEYANIKKSTSERLAWKYMYRNELMYTVTLIWRQLSISDVQFYVIGRSAKGESIIQSLDNFNQFIPMIRSACKSRRKDIRYQQNLNRKMHGGAHDRIQVQQ